MGDTRGGEITRGDLPLWGGVTERGFLWKWECPIGAGGGEDIPRELKEGGRDKSSTWRPRLEGGVGWPRRPEGADDMAGGCRVAGGGGFLESGIL